MSESLFEWAERHQHHNPHAGEEAAAEKAAKQSVALKPRIYQAILDAGHYGLTPDEFCKDTGKLINTVRRRITDLWKEGKVRHHPDELHRTNDDGNDCIVWVAGTDPAGTKTRHEKLKDENKILRQALAEFVPFAIDDEWIEQQAQQYRERQG